MVAITVILAAVIGAFVLGFGGEQSTAPTPVIEDSTERQVVEFNVEGGDPFDAEKAELQIDVTVANATTGNTESTSLSVGLTESVSNSITVGSQTVDVEYSSSIGDDEVAAGDSFQVSLSGTPSGNDLAITEYDARIVWDGGNTNTQLYTNTYSESFSGSTGSPGGGGGGGGSLAISSSLDTTTPPSTVTTEVTSGSFDGSAHDFSVEVTLEDTSNGTTDTEVFSDRASQNWLFAGSAAGDPVFHQVGGGSVEYTSFTGGDSIFDTGERAEIAIDADDPGVEVVKVRLGFVERSSGDVLYQETVVDNT
jgi:FlaG/FlaF family flagellin (archaellin)